MILACNNITLTGIATWSGCVAGHIVGLGEARSMDVHGCYTADEQLGTWAGNLAAYVIYIQ
jgi:hypothetical protein